MMWRTHAVQEEVLSPVRPKHTARGRRGGSVLGGFVFRRLTLQGTQLAALAAASAVLRAEHLPLAVQASGASCLGVLSIAAGGLNSLVSHSVIHATAHPGSFSGSRRLDLWIGKYLCIENLQGHDEFRVLHSLHHLCTNGPQDPHHIRPGETWLHYVLTLYPRNTLLTWQQGYQELARKYLGRPQPARQALATRHKRLCTLGRWVARHRSLLTIVGTVTAILAGSWLIAGARGLGLALIGWFAPIVVGYVLIADFGYRTHVGLPNRAVCEPYRGQDTRSFSTGLIWAIANTLTFDFYIHRPHHLRPGRTIWAADAQDQVRT